MVSLFVHLVSAWVLGLAMQLHPAKTPPKVEERMEMKAVPATPTPVPVRPTM